MLQVLAKEKRCFKVSQITMSRTLATPEFDKSVLWSYVKDSPEFLSYIPDTLIRNPMRIPKDWLWRLIVAFDPDFAERYSEHALRIHQQGMRIRRRRTIQVAPEFAALLEKYNIRPTNGILVMPR